MMSIVGQWKTELNDCTLSTLLISTLLSTSKTSSPTSHRKKSCHGTSIVGNSYVTQRLWLVPGYG